MPRIRIDIPGHAPLFEIVSCVRERLIRTTKYGPMEFERNGDVDGVPRFSPSKPRARRTYVDPRTDYPGDDYEIPPINDRARDEARFASVGYGIGSASGMCARAYTLEDEDAEMRRAKARKARAAVKDAFGRERKRREAEGD